MRNLIVEGNSCTDFWGGCGNPSRESSAPIGANASTSMDHPLSHGLWDKYFCSDKAIGWKTSQGVYLMLSFKSVNPLTLSHQRTDYCHVMSLWLRRVRVDCDRLCDCAVDWIWSVFCLILPCFSAFPHPGVQEALLYVTCSFYSCHDPCESILCLPSPPDWTHTNDRSAISRVISNRFAKTSWGKY